MRLRRFIIPPTFVIAVPLKRSAAMQKVVDDAVAKRKMWFQTDDASARLVTTSKGAADFVAKQIAKHGDD